MRPGAGGERHEPRGQGLVVNAAARRLSNAAAASGLVGNPGSADVNQSTPGDFCRVVFDGSRRPDATGVKCRRIRCSPSWFR
uniref:Uncharacterized protein n=1 Tax=Peronospora matthiolae TaxID=2874970 RepID=A0AAV1TBH6_9STRA